MRRLNRPVPLHSVTASASRITGKTIETMEENKHSIAATTAAPQDHAWQTEAWEMYDLVGELRFIANTISEQMSKARLYVGRIDPSNITNSPDEVSDDFEVLNVLTAFGKTNAGRQQLLRRLGINMYVPGEGWLVGVPSSLLQGQESVDSIIDSEWFMLSKNEVTSGKPGTDKNKVTLELPDYGTREFHIDQIHLIRVWQPHPRYQTRADSPTKASLPVLRELVGLTMHVSAQVQSRLAGAGLLIVPQSAQQLMEAKNIGDDAVEAGEGDDAFTEALMEAMLTPINNRSSAAAIVPVVATVPDEAAGNFHYLSFSAPLDAEARNLRDEAIRRLALSQDAPPELLLGTSSMNHWGGWLVREDTIATHLEPTLALICDALTTQYLWPVLEEFGYTREQAEELVVWYDVSHLRTRPNQSQDAMALHDRGVISDDQLRASMGFDDDEEYQELDLDQAENTALKMVMADPRLLQNPGIDVLVQQLRRLFEKKAGEGEELPVPAPYDPRRRSSLPSPEEGAPATIPQTDGEDAEVP